MMITIFVTDDVIMMAISWDGDFMVMLMVIRDGDGDFDGDGANCVRAASDCDVLCFIKIDFHEDSFRVELIQYQKKISTLNFYPRNATYKIIKSIYYYFWRFFYKCA